MLVPLRNGILFIFLDNVKQGSFQETTSWGFQLSSTSDDSAKKARWAKVLAIGEEVSKDSGIKVGTYICIEPLMWTEGMRYDGIQVWRTDETKVMLVSDEAPT